MGAFANAQKTPIIVGVLRPGPAAEGRPVGGRRGQDDAVGAAQRVVQKCTRITPGEDQDRRGLPTRRLHRLRELAGTEPVATGRITGQRQALARAMRGGIDETPLAGLDLEHRDGGSECGHRGEAHGGGHPGGIGGELLDYRDVVLLEQHGQRRNGVVKRRNGIIAR